MFKGMRMQISRDSDEPSSQYDRPTRSRTGPLRIPQHQRESPAPRDCRGRRAATHSRSGALRSRLAPSRDDQVTEWVGGRHRIAVAGALFLVLELSFERVPGLRQRPDILGEPSPSLHADEAPLHPRPQERLRDVSCMDADPVAEGLVVSRLGRRLKAEVTWIPLVQRTATVPHASRETVEHGRIRALLHSPLQVESRSCLNRSSRHWLSAVRMLE